MYTSTNINCLLRELSGPRPLRRGMDIVFRPRIWDHGALTFSFKALPIFRATAAGRVATPPTPTPPHANTTSTLDCPISLAYTMRKFWDTEQQTSASGTLLRRIYISLVLRTVTHSGGLVLTDRLPVLPITRTHDWRVGVMIQTCERWLIPLAPAPGWRKR